MKKNNLNIEKACRVCLKESERSKLLRLNLTILEKLNFVDVPIDLEHYIKLPECICNKCEEELESVYTFLIKLKLSKLRLKSIYTVTDAERIQPFVKNEHSKSDFIGNIQILENIQIHADYVDAYEDELPISQINSISTIDIDKVSTYEGSYIDYETEIQVSPIKKSRVVDDHYNSFNPSQIQTSSIESYVIDLSTAKHKTSPIESCEIDLPWDKQKISPMGSCELDLPLDKPITSPIQICEIDRLFAKLESSPIECPVIDLSSAKHENSPIESIEIYLPLDELNTSPIQSRMIDLPSTKLETSHIESCEIDLPLDKLETSPIQSREIDQSFAELENSSIESPTIDLSSGELKTSPVESCEIDRSLANVETTAIESCEMDRSSAKLVTSSIETECIVKLTKLKISQDSRTSLAEVTSICHICGKTFSTRNNLKRHIREHEGRRYICTYENCKSFFTQRSSLKLHILIHKGEKNFLCLLCNKKFSQQKSLQFHLRIHAGKHFFACNYCNKGFYQRTNLVRHLKTRCYLSKPKKFQCDRCQKYYASNQSLQRHIVLHERTKEIIRPYVNPVQILPIELSSFILKNDVS